MAIIYSYPEIPEVQGGDLLLISDTGAPNKPTRSVDIDDLAAYIGTVVGVVQNLQSVLTVGNTYVSPDGYGTFTLNDITNSNGNIKYANTDEGWGYALNAEEGLYFTDGNGGFDNGKSSFAPYAVWIGNGTHQAQINSTNLTASRIFQFPNIAGTIALTSDIPAPGPGGSGTTNYTARWIDTDTLGVGALYDNGTNVGIGTANPTQKLEVNGTVLLSTLPNNNGRLCLGSVSTNLFSNAASGHLYISTNGSTRMTILDDGNVGIGTTSPSQKLEVIGNIKVSSTTYSPNLATWGNVPMTIRSDDYIRFLTSSSNNERIRILNNGNVGIGTTAPAYKVSTQVASNNTYAYYVANSSGSNRGGIYVDSNGHTRFLGRTGAGDTVQISASGTSYLNGGNVGIGTTSPSSKFQVSANDGDGITLKHGASNAFFILRDGNDDTIIKQTRNYTSKISISTLADSGTHESSGLNIVGQGVGLKSNVGIGTTSPSQKLEVSGAVLAGDYRGSNQIYLTSPDSWIFRSTTGNERMRITSAGNVGIGTTSPGSILEINGGSANGVKITAANSGTEFVLNASTSNGTSRLWVGGNGNVGIGTTAPTEKFEVSGARSSLNGIKIGENGTNIQFPGDGKLSVDNNDWLIVSEGGAEVMRAGGANRNVGIGTTSPSESLEISKSANHGIKLSRPSSGSNPGDVLMQVHSSGKFNLTADNDVAFTTGTSTDSFVIKANTGNVGIGTTSPDAKLEVAASATTSVDIAHFSNSNDVVKIKHVLDTLGSGGISIFDASNNEDIRLSAQSDSWFNAGNVGIGTTSPSQKLEVAGNIQATGTRFISCSFDANHYMRIESNSSGGILKGTDGGVITTLVRTYGDSYFNGGNVGIGTTSPSEKLEVVGNVRIDSTSVAQMYLDSAANNDAVLNFQEAGIQKGKVGYDTSLAGLALVTGSGPFSSADMVVLDSGNVGIGTTSPGTKLHVGTGSGATIDTGYQAVIDSPGIAGLQILSATTQSGRIVFGDSDDNDIGMIKYDHTDNSMGFRTNGSANERMRITNAGNVGIGTTNPAKKLHVLNSTNEAQIRLGQSGSGSYDIGVYANDTFSIGRDADTQEFNIKNGNVGIGTTSPDRKLEVDFTGSVYGAKFTRSDATGSSLIEFANSAGVKSKIGYDAGVDGFHIGTASATNVVVKQNGNVGIGTTNPGAKLSVNGNVKIEGTNSLLFGGSATVPSWAINYNGSDLLIDDQAGNTGSVLFNNNEGVALPRLTTTEINAISSPAQGLMAYNTTLNTICFYNGSSWQKVSHANM